MATKISGIKGINISKASVLKDGSKKSGTNDNTRDTANGTTRDNSGNKTALDAAMIKMLLGQTELMAKKATQIEAQMKIAAQKEADRQKREEDHWRKQQEYEEKRKDRDFGAAVDKIDKGIINSALAGVLGPVGVMLGKGLNAAGLPVDKLAKKGLRAGGKLINKGLNATLGRWSRKADEEEGALSVNRREEAAKPVYDLRSTVSEGFKKVLDKMGGGKGGEEKPDDESWLSKLLKYALPLLAGILSGYQPLKDFGIKYLLKRLGKPIDWVIKQLGKLGSKAWKVLKGPLSKIGSKMWKALKTPFQKLGSKVWGVLKGPLAKAGSSIKKAFSKIGSRIWKTLKGPLTKAGSSIMKAFSKLGSKLMKSGFMQALKTAGKTLTKSAGKIIEKVAKPLNKVGAKIVSKVGQKVASKAASKAVTKGTAKAAGKGLLKKIPGVSTLAGLWFGAERAMKGDWKGAGLEVLSGVLGNFAGLGTAASIGIDAYLLGKDIKRDLDAEKQQEQTTAASEGSYETEAPDYRELEYQQEQAGVQNEILNTLRQIEVNLDPTVQQKLDNNYLEMAKRMFDQAPTYQDDRFQDFYNNLENLKVLNVKQ